MRHELFLFSFWFAYLHVVTQRSVMPLQSGVMTWIVVRVLLLLLDLLLYLQLLWVLLTKIWIL
jgi:formate hydrogenlyase subunit 3/multisubunit Na+/H+ antiporter MnhD subunit